jgi:PBP1b-binding outer membrane lipoprotein LpoB
MINRRTIASTLAIVAVSGLLLTGCSAGAQSKAAACKVLQTDAAGAQATLSGAFSKITDDPSAAEKALKAFDTKFAASVAKVSNPTVKAASAAASKSLSALDADLAKYAADPTDTAAVSALQKDASKVQTTFSKLGGVCSA